MRGFVEVRIDVLVGAIDRANNEERERCALL